MLASSNDCWVPADPNHEHDRCELDRVWFRNKRPHHRNPCRNLGIDGRRTEVMKLLKSECLERAPSCLARSKREPVSEIRAIGLTKKHHAAHPTIARQSQHTPCKLKKNASNLRTP